MPVLPDIEIIPSGSTASVEPTDTPAPPTIRVEVCPHPFSAQRQTHSLHPPSSINQLLHEVQLRLRPGVKYAVCIDGRPIPESEWEWLAPHENAVVTIRSIPRGGNGKNIALIILGVLMITGAIFAAVALGPAAYTFAGIVGKFGFALIAIGTIGLIAPGPQSLPKQGSTEPTLVSTITGTQNKMNPYGAIPRVLGAHRMYPPLGAVPYTELFNNDQYLRMLFVVGYGPVHISDIRIGATPIDEYEDVEYEWLEGRPTDNKPAYYTKNVKEETFDILLSSVESWQTRTTAINANEIILDIIAPLGLLYVQEDGDRKSVTVRIDIEYAVIGTGAWVAAPQLILSGRQGGIIRKSVRIETGLNQQYDVRVRKNTPDNNGDTYIDEVRWTVLRTVDLSHPIQFTKPLALISVRIRASNQLNGVINQLNCIARSYLQCYTGTGWAEALSTNPAWCFATVFTDNANATPLSTTRLDLPTIYAWAVWCDNNGYAYNKIIDEKRTVFELVREIAAAGRASFNMRDSLYSITRDMPQTVPVQHITARNSWDYSGNKIFIDQLHGARVEYINESANGTEDEMVVYADGFNNLNATNLQKLQFPGVTMPSQVFRLARYHIAQVILRPEVHSVMMDIESLVCSRGDLVEMVHDVPKFGLGAGRITVLEESGATVTGLRFDEFWIHDPDKEYAVRIRKSTGASLLLNVVTVGGQNDGVTFSTPIAEGELRPEVGDLILFGEQDSTTVRMLIKSITPQSELTARIELVDEAPGVLTADSQPVGTFDTHITQPPSLESLVPPTPSIISMVSDETIMDRGPDRNLRSRVVINLFIPGSTRNVGSYFFQVQWRLNDIESLWLMSPLVPVDQGRVFVDQVEDKEIYEFRARTTNGAGLHSPWTASIVHTVVGKSTPPPDVSSVFVEMQADGTRVFSWTLLSPPPDIDGFVLRYKIGIDGTWLDSRPLHTGVLKSSPFETNQLSAGQYTFLIKAIDTGGTESVNPKLVISTLGDPRLSGALLQVNARGQSWPGTLVDCVEDPSGVLIAAGQKTWADFAVDGVTWGDWTMWNRVPISPIFYQHPIIDLGAVVSFTPLVTAVGNGTPTFLESHSDDGVTYTSFTTPGPVIRARYILVQVAMSGGTGGGVIEEFLIIIDANAVVEDQGDVDTSTLSGTTGDRRLALLKSFSLITSAAIALQNVGPGWSWEIIDKDPSLGPRIKIYNGSNALADAVIDIVVRGLA